MADATESGPGPRPPAPEPSYLLLGHGPVAKAAAAAAACTPPSEPSSSVSDPSDVDAAAPPAPAPAVSVEEHLEKVRRDRQPEPSDEEVDLMMAKWDLTRVAGRLHEVSMKQELSDEDLNIVANEILSFIQALLATMRNVREGVENDILNNVHKIRAACTASRARSLKDMVAQEIQASINYRDSGREALLWLKRSLSFILEAVKNMLEKHEDSVPKNVIDAYNRRLSRCHNFFVRPIVRMYLGKLPRRDELYSRLTVANCSPVDSLNMSKTALSSIVERLTTLCREFDLEHIQILQH